MMCEQGVRIQEKTVMSGKLRVRFKVGTRIETVSFARVAPCRSPKTDNLKDTLHAIPYHLQLAPSRDIPVSHQIQSSVAL